MDARGLAARLRRDDLAIVALGVLLPVAGLLVSSGIAEALIAFGRSDLALQLIGSAIHDAIYLQIAREQLTHLALSYDGLALAPWGLAAQLEGTVLAETVVAFGTSLVLLALGLCVASQRPRLQGLAAVRLVALVGYHLTATNTLLNYRLTVDSADKMGLAAAVSKFGGNDARAYQLVAGTLEVLFPVGLLALAHVYVFGRWWQRGARGTTLPSAAAVAVAVAIAVLSPAASAGPADGGAAPPIAAAGPARQPLRTGDGGAAMPSVDAGRAQQQAQTGNSRAAPEPPGERPLRPLVFHPTAPTRPPRVELRLTDEGWLLLRDSEPMVIKGMGYSTVVHERSREGRMRKWAEDFRAIAASGFNTVVGWEDEQHSQPWTTEVLDLAHQAGLGVILPFYLPSKAAYAQPMVRERYRAEVAAWVRAYRTHPALLMWGLGNEVLHGIGLERPAEAAAFSAFYWELADLVRELDPQHPVTYRGGEEYYIAPLIAAYRETGVERPWFAYGVNVYNAGPRPRHFRRVLHELWPARAWPVAAYVSEFNALGLDEQTRPKTLVKMWRIIHERPGAFLGGAVYVWSTAGPEVADRSLGLVDGQNRPVDRALELLGAELRRERPSLRRPSLYGPTVARDEG
ncbi:MAG: hypothetical protein HY691_17095 [Chloroflexi bacterium]|nr:hypothetical protein [Chloroflexota bacterium]